MNYCRCHAMPSVRQALYSDAWDSNDLFANEDAGPPDNPYEAMMMGAEGPTIPRRPPAPIMPPIQRAPMPMFAPPPPPHYPLVRPPPPPPPQYPWYPVGPPQPITTPMPVQAPAPKSPSTQSVEYAFRALADSNRVLADAIARPPPVTVPAPSAAQVVTTVAAESWLSLPHMSLAMYAALFVIGHVIVGLILYLILDHTRMRRQVADLKAALAGALSPSPSTAPNVASPSLAVAPSLTSTTCPTAPYPTLGFATVL